MDSLPRIKVSGALEGDYVVLARRAGGQLRIAPEHADGLPKVVALRRTTWACPTQWVATLADGRTVYARSRHGEFSVGVGDDLDDAVLKSGGPEALYFEYVQENAMGFDELRAHLYGLLEFPDDLQVELLNRRRWRTRVELANAIFEYIESFHNDRRRHSSLNMLTPTEFEELHQKESS